MRERLRRLAGRLRGEESGQELIEYAILTGIIGITTLLLYTTVQGTAKKNYTDANTDIQNVWQPLPPGGQ